MGTSSTFKFYKEQGLDFDVSFDSSYGVYREYMDIPVVWQKCRDNGESMIIYNVTDLIEFWDKNPPNYYALQDLHQILKMYGAENISCSLYEWHGWPKDVSGQGRITLEYGL